MSAKLYRPFDTSLVIPDNGLRQSYRLVQPLIEYAFGFHEIQKIYNFAKGRPPAEFAQRCLDYNRVCWSMTEEDLAQLQAINGPLVINCNHPFGGADALSLIPLMEKLRPGGWRLFANFAVCRIPELRPYSIPVDPLGGKKALSQNRQGMAQGLRFLREGGLLASFSAGRVSHLDPESHAPVDRAWTGHTYRLAESAGATIVTLHIPGQNSDRFLKVPPRWSRLRALMLCHEICHPTTEKVQLRLAEVIKAEDVTKLGRSKNPSARLRAHCFLRADEDLPRPATRQGGADSAPSSEPAENLADVFGEFARASSILKISGRDVLLFQGSDAPAAVMNEIGRCREITFRAAGQGVGSNLDLTPEDPYYHHLVVWDQSTRELVGAYRMGKVQDIMAALGPQGLYLDHVFKIDPTLYQKIGNAFELSRSFIVPKFQRDNRALGALWRGLGEGAKRHQCGTFFGSVTISNDHHPASRAILVEHLRRNYGDDEEFTALVRARNPFHPSTRYHRLVGQAYEKEKIDALAPLIERIENQQRGIPPLMRYYCTLGAKFLAYHVEPTFRDALYCSLRVDLQTIEQRYRRRFLGT